MFLAQYAKYTGSKRQKILKNVKTDKIIERIQKKRLLVSQYSHTIFDKKSLVHREAGFPGGDNIRQTGMATYRLNRPSGRFSEHLKSS